MTSTLLPNHLELIKNIAKEEGIENYQLEINNDQKGDGYMSKIVLVSITSSERASNLVVKIASKSVKLRSESPIHKLFEREIFLYTEIFTFFEKLQNNVEKLFAPPKCYNSISKEYEECLVLENLKKQGFQLWNRKIPMDHNHLDLMFRTYGKYHALSSTVQYFYPDKYAEWFKKLDNINKYFVVDNSDTQFAKLFRNVMNLFDDETIKKKIENLGKNWKDVYLHNIPEKYAVLNHGDGWCNNFLFKYENPTDFTKPTDIRLLDYQIATFATPIHDLSYCFFIDTDKQYFSKYRDYLDIYYTTMADVLKQYNFDINSVYPHKILEEHWKEYANYGLMNAIYILNIALVSPEDALDMGEIAENDCDTVEFLADASPQNFEYNKRVKDLIYFFIDNNWF